MRDGDLTPGILLTLLRAELAAGIYGLRLFIACVAIATAMLGAVWMLGDGLSRSLERSGSAILGGDIAVSVVNAPLDESLVARIAENGTLSRVAELRTSATAKGVRAPVEMKGVDAAYPLYGKLVLAEGSMADFQAAASDRRPGALVERELLARFGAAVGDPIRLGQTEFIIRGVIETEPDRLSAGRFLVGPRIIVGLKDLPGTGLLAFGSLVDFRYRLKVPDGSDIQAALLDLRNLTPEGGWELETPKDAGDRVRRTVDHTTTFLGAAGIVALAVGLAGAWAAANVWVSRRSRTIALYRLSGATPAVVVALHGMVIAIAAAAGMAFGFAVATVTTVVLMDIVSARLQLLWHVETLAIPALQVAGVLVLGLAGASSAALSGAAHLSPGAAMRSGDAPLSSHPRHLAFGAAAMAGAVALAIFSLPIPGLAAAAAAGLVLAAAVLGLCGWVLARFAMRRQPRGFVGRVAMHGLAIPGAVATKAVAIGIGIAGVTAIIAAQNSLEVSLRAELPERIPDLVLLDIQPHQVEMVRARIDGDPGLGDLQASPFMRATILKVNGVPAEEALRLPGKSWVIEGDRSFAWSAAPTGAELLAGEWWPEDYSGPPVVSAEEDVQEAFDLKPGDRLTYSVLGRTFTSEVANIRKEYHRTFRPEFLLVASPQPFREAPHSWVMSLEGNTDDSVDALIRDLAATAPNVTSIDIRKIVTRVIEVIDGAVLASLAVAATLLAAGALSLASVVAADVDARRREALAFVLIGASRMEVAMARLGEAACVGALAAVLGGIAGQAGGYWLVQQALRVDWSPGAVSIVLPLLLGVLSALAAGAAGGLGAVPRGRGQVARLLTS